MSMKRAAVGSSERLARERQLAEELGLVIPAAVLGLPSTPKSSLIQMRIVPPTEPAPEAAHRVLPPRGPRRPVSGHVATPAILHATIEEQLRRIELGDRHLVPGLIDQYGELAAQGDPTPEFAALRRRVLSAAHAGDVGDVPQGERGAGPQSRRIA